MYACKGSGVRLRWFPISQGKPKRGSQSKMREENEQEGEGRTEGFREMCRKDGQDWDSILSTEAITG